MKKSKMEKWIKYYDMGIGIFAIILIGLAIVSWRYNQESSSLIGLMIASPFRLMGLD